MISNLHIIGSNYFMFFLLLHNSIPNALRVPKPSIDNRRLNNDNLINNEKKIVVLPE